MTYYSQIGQDEWVNSVLKNKKNGYFVELGACDGIYLSNTLYFEKNLNWDGLCIEPNDNYIEDLKKNRICNISNELVSSFEGEIVDFSVCYVYSGIISESLGPHSQQSNIVKKETNTLTNILDKFNAPSIIDYL
jgi:hypothetical protein